MISAEDRARQKELQEELGSDAAFFDSPIGLIAVAPPEQPAESYWTMVRDLANEKLDKSSVLSAFAVKCVVHPAPADVAACFRARPALAAKIAGRVRQILGESVTVDPELDEKELPEESQALAKLREKHGSELSWYMVENFGLVVLAPPSSPACYRQYFNACANDEDDERPEEVHSTFALDCVVHPSRDAVAGLFKLRPGLVRKFAFRGDGLCGNDFQELGKV